MNYGSNEGFHDFHLGLNILKMVLQALTLKDIYRDIPLVYPRLKGLPQTKYMPQKINTQVSVTCNDFDLHTLEIKVIF